MNTRFLTTLSLRASLLLGSLSALTLGANAQTPITRASVPFEFAAGGTMLPAGEYSIDIPDLSGVIFLHGSSGKTIALLTTFSSAISNAGSSKLVFQKRGGLAYLSAVECPGESVLVMSAFKGVSRGPVEAAIH